jgi:selT/selW/selH-like putative selenoprotein
VSSIIKKYDAKAIIEGNNNPPRTGSFEVEMDGELLFSKFELNRFPTESEIKSWL